MPKKLASEEMVRRWEKEDSEESPEESPEESDEDRARYAARREARAQAREQHREPESDKSAKPDRAKKAEPKEAKDPDLSLPGSGQLGEDYGPYDARPRLIDCLPLSMAGKSILIKLFAYQIHGVARVSQPRLALDVSSSKKTVHDILEQLEVLKLIKRIGKGRKGSGSSLYRVFFPKEWPVKLITAARKEDQRRREMEKYTR